MPSAAIRSRSSIRVSVAGLEALIAERVADAGDRAFRTAPKLKWSSHHSSELPRRAFVGDADPLSYDAIAADAFTTRTAVVSASTGNASLMRRKVARACPTIWSML